MTSPRAGYGLIAGAATSWGTWSLFLRTAEAKGPLPAALEALVVMVIIALGVLPFALRDSRNYRGPRRPFGTMLALGLGDAFNILLFFQAMRLSSLAIAVLSHSLAPILVAAFAPLSTGERPRARTWGAIVVALSGLTLLLEPWTARSQGAFLGAAAGAGSAVFYAANVLLQKRLAGRFTPAELLSYHAFPASIVLWLAVPAGGLALRGDQAALLAVAAVGPGALAGLAFVRGLSVVPASHAALVALLEPAVAVLLGVAVWGEPIGLLGAVGASLVLGAVVSIVSSASPRADADALTRS